MCKTFFTQHTQFVLKFTHSGHIVLQVIRTLDSLSGMFNIYNRQVVLWQLNTTPRSQVRPSSSQDRPEMRVMLPQTLR